MAASEGLLGLAFVCQAFCRAVVVSGGAAEIFVCVCVRLSTSVYISYMGRSVSLSACMHDTNTGERGMIRKEM